MAVPSVSLLDEQRTKENGTPVHPVRVGGSGVPSQKLTGYNVGRLLDVVGGRVVRGDVVARYGVVWGVVVRVARFGGVGRAIRGDVVPCTVGGKVELLPVRYYTGVARLFTSFVVVQC